MDRLPTILIVEDDPIHLRIIGDILKREGYTVIETANINDAFKKIQKFQDGAANAGLIVIIDVGIPQSSDSLLLKRGGIDFLKDLRQEYPKIPAILLTVYGYADDVIKIAKQYNVPIITKPLNSMLLLKTVRDMTKRITK